MDSGSILHLALLRKTSNAKKRKHLAKSKKPLLEDNFTLSGWSIEEGDIKE